MIIIGLFFPALISVAIRQKRKTGCELKAIPVIIEYGITVLFINLFVMSLITYVFHIQDITLNTLENFSFFTKFTALSVLFAIVFPYVEEIFKKWIQINFFIEKKEQNAEK
jgi:RsiW-degrading membrane proteinase PrsW (M82 family)